ncbi:MAG: hypothetical protein Q7T20_08095 [Saprospiraceae bacterium]|nr:hypothetical protein [Saprospiraceae bacterium]
MKPKLFLLLLLPCFLNAQTEKPRSEASKGIFPIVDIAGAGLRPVTRAVVVGISSYQDPAHYSIATRVPGRH